MSSTQAPSAGADHGWWPYLLPYFGFILSAELATRLPESLAPATLVVRPLIPASLIFYFWRLGRYPELRGFRAHAGGVWQDVLVGLALTVLWMAPLLLGVDLFLAEHVWSGLGPPRAGSGLDPDLFGPSGLPLLLFVRGVGFALVTPIFEELFIRSFVMRYADVFDTQQDFRRAPMARYTRRSFWVATVVFTAAHLPWEWIVAVPWVALSSLWFYRRGHIGSVIVVHAVTNAAILIFVAAMGGQLQIGSRLIDLWIFV